MKIKHFIPIIVILLLALVLLYNYAAPQPALAPAVSSAAPPTAPAPAATPAAAPGEELLVAVLDVGQADCILVSSGGHAMLIDAGNLDQDELVTGYLADYGVKSLDYLVATHPHADHIGAMSAVVYAMEDIGTVLMPDAVATTRVFENLLSALEERDFAVTVPQPGDSFALGEAVIEVLAPAGADYDDMNNYSLVVRVSYGQTAFLFTGDAESISEAEQLQGGQQLKADVLKVGHHGSSSSTTEAYLTAVSPRYAVISCGKDNSYGHPHRETMRRLSNHGITVYRTDELGTVEFTTDGVEIMANGERLTSRPQTSVAAVYIGNKNSKSLHRENCSSLPAEQNRVIFNTREAAVAAGYKPCQSCKP